jgi:Ribbon-helix-helix protein, copG family
MRHRHALYLSEAMTQRLQLVAEAHRLSKSEILERALRRYLTAENNGPSYDLINIQQEANARSLRRLERDLAIAVELTATFVRYFVMITPPLPEDAHEAARALGQLRFEQVIENVATRLRTNRGLVARVMAMVDQSNPHELHADSRQPDKAHAPSTTDAVPGRSTTDPRDG